MLGVQIKTAGFQSAERSGPQQRDSRRCGDLLNEATNGTDFH